MPKTIVIAVATGLLAMGTAAGCANATPNQTGPSNTVSGTRVHGGPGGGPRMGMSRGGVASVTGTATLSANEKRDLQYLTEEEKVAHDLYALAYDTYGLRIFANIAASETHHQQSLKRILSAYRLSDPTQGQPAGTFTDPDLQALYDSLSAQVLQSQQAALDVGVAVERADIADLAQAKGGMPREVQRVLGHLLVASEQHLRAFSMWSR